MLTRLPIRLRLAVVFTGVMALLLAVGAVLLHILMAKSLDDEIRRALRTRVGDIQSLVIQSDRGPAETTASPLTEQGESIAQIVDRSGRVVDATPGLRSRSLLSPDQLRAAERGVTSVDRAPVPGDPGSHVRLLAAPVTAHGQRLVVVAGADLDRRDETLRELAVLLGIGGPLALLVASLAGYWLASAALRPIEAMRRRAQLISGGDPGARLPLAASRDEVRRLGETLNAMLERIDAAIARERTFVSDASHELRTPLAILKGELELAQRPGRRVDELREAIDSAAEETDRLVRIAEDLLVIARLDQGRLPIRREVVDVAALLERVRSRFEGRAGELDRTLRLEAPEGLTVPADPLRTEQAVGNLIENALRHGEGPVTMVARPGGEGVEIHVTDHGAGFPDEFVPSAFERFTRADDARSRGGAGLGLSIVDAIARAHGGSAGVRNDAGADVWIALPDGTPPASTPGG